jgi:Zn-dependent protease with chaperone function
MDREVFPHVQWRDLMRQLGFALALQAFPWLVLVGALITMPNVFNLQSAIVAIAAVALTAFWSQGGFIRVGQRFGFFVEPSATLQEIVRNTAARMNVPVKRVWLLRIPLAQAWALPPLRTLIFTERLLQLCPSEEVEAICAHELAHLDERFLQYASRYILWLTFLPFIFIVPAINTFGLADLAVIFCPVFLAPMLYRRVSRKLEVRADQIAYASQPTDQAYARALVRLHEDALLPAVLAKSHATHPHLYDRLIAAGMTPDFPRPKAAKSMAWHGRVFAAAIGVVIMFLLSRP